MECKFHRICETVVTWIFYTHWALHRYYNNHGQTNNHVMLKPVMNTAVPPVSLTAELLYVQYPKDVYVRGVLNFEVGILHTGRTSNNKGNSNFLRTFSAFYFIFSAVMKVGYTIVLKMKQKVEKHCFTKVSYNSGEGSVNFALFAMLSGLESLSYMNWKDTDCLLLGQLL